MLSTIRDEETGVSFFGCIIHGQIQQFEQNGVKFFPHSIPCDADPLNPETSVEAL